MRLISHFALRISHSTKRSIMKLKFIGYQVNESNYKLNDIPKGTVNFTVNPNIQMDIKKDPKKLLLAISVTVRGTEEKPAPFDLFTKITGTFDIVEDSLDINRMRIDSSRILFPYVRAYVSTLTSLSGMPPYVLPLIDFEGAPVQKGVPVPPTAPKKSGIDGIKITPIDEV